MSTKGYMRITGGLVELVTERVERTVKLDDLLAETARQQGVSTPVLPTGCRLYRAVGDRTVFVIEQAPTVRRLVWRRMDHEGREQWKLAFPYVIFVVAFAAEAVDTLACRVYYRNAPISGVDDKLARPNLTNTYQDGRICTGDFRVTGSTPAAKAEAFVAQFWASNFNSDLADFNFLPTGRNHSQIATLAAWQEASEQNPLFPLSLAWLEGPKLGDVLAQAVGGR